MLKLSVERVNTNFILHLPPFLSVLMVAHTEFLVAQVNAYTQTTFIENHKYNR